MAKKTKEKSLRVGLLVSGALLTLMIFVFFIGSEQKIFARKNEYRVELENVSGLAQGNPVKMSGVTIGVIGDIRLPRDPSSRSVELTVMIDRKFSERVRGDSRVRLKKLGLLAGDSYIDVTPGSPRFPAMEPGSLIPSQRQTNVDQLLSSGEDLVDNLVQISYSLKNILSRVDRGEGLIGELTTAPETKQRITDTFLTTLNKTNAALTHMESGKGVMGKLIYDDAYAEQLTISVSDAARGLATITANVQGSFERGEGMIPTLLNDREGARRVTELVENLRLASVNLAGFTDTMSKGEGLVPRLMNDKAYGDQALGEFTVLIQQLNQVVSRINNGEGTAGRIVTDPSLYESVNDILIGINESKLLRWLIRNRQQSGIEKRAREAAKAPVVTTPEAPPVVTPATEPPPIVNPTTEETPAPIPAPAETVAPPAEVTTVPPVTDTASTTTTAPPQ
jgi:phospholipid/cholesterol/gamma-HCH transport system substrate-binding protein